VKINVQLLSFSNSYTVLPIEVNITASRCFAL